MAQHLEQGVIEHIQSAWNFPIVLVDKNDGGIRMCINYKSLNKITKPDIYPIPLIQDALDSLGGNDLFTKLDMNQMFYHLRVHPDSVERTAISTHNGHYHFLRTPFGLKNSLSLAQRAMNNVLAQEIRTICFVYLDDIIVYSKGFSQHMQRLKQIFNKFREFNVKLKASKCNFFKQSVSYLGHLINKTGIKPDPDRIKPGDAFKLPQNPTDINSQLGFVAYYNRYYYKYSFDAEPLLKLLRQDVPWEWGPEQQAVWEKMKNKLKEAPYCVHYDPTAQHELHTDACGYGIAGILVQYRDKRKEGFVTAVSKTLNKTQRSWAITEKECYAIVWSIQKLRVYIHQRYFKVVTDHCSLCYLMKSHSNNAKLMGSAQLTGRELTEKEN